MKKAFLFLSAITLLLYTSSCTSDRKGNDNLDSSAAENEAGSEISKPEIISDIPWTALLDSTTQKYSLKKSELVASSDLDSTNVIESINRKYPENKVTWLYQNGDTAFVSIADATYLTQRSGSMGAQVFLAESTYSLTEIPGVNVVFFKFALGDHATPGPYTRKSFDFSMP